MAAAVPEQVEDLPLSRPPEDPALRTEALPVAALVAVALAAAEAALKVASEVGLSAVVEQVAAGNTTTTLQEKTCRKLSLF